MLTNNWISFAAGLCVAWSIACTPMLPMHELRVSDAEVGRIQQQIGLDATPAQIRDPKIDHTFEVTVPCSEMLAICYEGMAWYWKALGSIPLACTKFWIGTDKDALNRTTGVWKTAIAYRCALTPEWAMEHEREHLKGRVHE